MISGIFIFIRKREGGDGNTPPVDILKAMGPLAGQRFPKLGEARDRKVF